MKSSSIPHHNQHSQYKASKNFKLDLNENCYPPTLIAASSSCSSSLSTSSNHKPRIKNSSTRQQGVKSDDNITIVKPFPNNNGHNYKTVTPFTGNHTVAGSIQSISKYSSNTIQAIPYPTYYDPIALSSGHHHIIKPTEAQLRWAQFNSKKRAKKTREKINSLMQYPRNVEDVAEAISDDGRSTTSSSSCRSIKTKGLTKIKTRKKKKVPMSKGRRALLRVSERHYCERRREAPQHSIGEDLDDSRETSVLYGVGESLTPINHNPSQKPSSNSKKKYHHLGRKQRLVDIDEERVKRYEEAYRSIMLQNSSFLSSQNDLDSQSTYSGKRWKRPDHILPAVSIDGKEYYDLQRSPSHAFKYDRHALFYKQTNDLTYSPAAASSNNDSRKEVRSLGYDKFQELLEKTQDNADRVSTTKSSGRRSEEKDAPSHSTHFIHPEVISHQSFSSSDEISKEPSLPSTEKASIISSPDPKVTTVPSSPISNSTITSPSRKSGITSRNLSDYSSKLHQQLSRIIAKKQVQETSNNDAIVTDSQTDVDIPSYSFDLSLLSLSPSVISKRFQNAIKMIQNHSWEELLDFIKANPWLSEMSHPANDLTLLHYFAHHGIHDAPDETCYLLFQQNEDNALKYDIYGNLPLHYACYNGYTTLISILIRKFEAGLTIQNKNGMLPLHLGLYCQEVEDIEFIVNKYPNSLSIKDDEGNLPFHTACLFRGEVATAVAKKLIELYEEFPFVQHQSVRSADNETGNENDVDESTDEVIPLGMIKNSDGNTPLQLAIINYSGWEMMDLLLTECPGGREAAMDYDETKNNALHSLLDPKNADDACILTLLKHLPILAAIPNGENVLPIELACMNNLSHEVLLALALLDLPIDVNLQRTETRSAEFGASWYFLTCDSNDDYISLVKEILSLCSYHQVRELCFMRGPVIRKERSVSVGPTFIGSVISRATPKCKLELRIALRFMGRYEFICSKSLSSDKGIGCKIFYAVDYGTTEDPISLSNSTEQSSLAEEDDMTADDYDDSSTNEPNQKVILKCYSVEESFNRECYVLIQQSGTINTLKMVEEFKVFCINDFEKFAPTPRADSQQNLKRDFFCVALQRPEMTLEQIIRFIPAKTDRIRYKRYFFKACVVLRQIAKAIQHLHGLNIIHGDIRTHTCGKFKSGDWKLMNIVGCRYIDEYFSQSRMNSCSPPESVDFDFQTLSTDMACFKRQIEASKAIDIWAFGKLMHDVITGKPFIPFSTNVKPRNDHNALGVLGSWDDEESLVSVLNQLQNFCNFDNDGLLRKSFLNLIFNCLRTDPKHRFNEMEDIVNHKFWKDLSKKVSEQKKKRESRSSRSSSSVS